jgi:glucan biosynthesis protein C
MKRIFYIDNIRIVLIALVVLHHLAITFGGPGGWYYIENKPDSFSVFPLSMFLATNQSFFMGMFYLISAYFTAISLKNKSTWSFLKSRLVRLGIPLLFFYFILSPLTIFILLRFGYGEDIQFFSFIKEHHGFGVGRMWFVEALLIFTMAYLIARSLFCKGNSDINLPKKIPKNYLIILTALAIGVMSFLVRIKFPLGRNLKPFEFQLAFFTQYIFFFIIGIVAYHNDWFETIPYKKSLNWFILAQVLILIVLPLAMVFGIGPSGNLDTFLGGWTWQSLAYSLWEQVTGFSLIIGLTGIFKRKLNTQNKLTRQLSASAYLVFIIHPLVLVSIGAVFKDLELYHLLKFLLLAPVALLSCFILAIVIRKIPLVNRVV